ncbi:pentapeptide repeat-containing protein [Brevibacterium sp. BRM-1]|uniref:pentapeptide repeat-containing protein n=1 Tax=Brevibacterium sp. BRM-1 TaxID=2999062 RepID=UPI00227DF917|nr:pentapeptide repeat-containing protein [Brevibacterium sp. BRM-1]WAL41182.1 pentapeptide repeat-containing protein [Brevibacterium sp. BRM-1]
MSAPAVPRPPLVSLPALSPGLPGDLGPEDRVDGLEFADPELGPGSARAASVLDCRFASCEFAGLDLELAALTGCAFDRCAAAGLALVPSRLSNVRFDGCRVGSLEAYGAAFERVEFAACRLGYVNLRGAVLRDVRFEQCRIGELDLGQATAARAACPQSELEALEVVGAALADVDLRGASIGRITGLRGLAGATLDEQQVALLAPALAAEFGIRIGDPVP